MSVYRRQLKLAIEEFLPAHLFVLSPVRTGPIGSRSG